MFNLSPIYSALKSSNHKLFFLKTQNQSCTQMYIKQNIHKHRKQNFRRISPFGTTPVEKAHKARTHWYCGPFRRFINTRLKRSIEKELTEAMKHLKDIT